MTLSAFFIGKPWQPLNNSRTVNPVIAFDSFCYGCQP